ncbi:cytochrome P450 [Auricularia subglabra TFB-10046 SS5]|nr:cytochrome P450 [Auricularia subglabra TFB-10046 SS5]
MSLSLPGGKTVIILNTLDAITDLLEKKSAAYSDRPVTVMSEMMGFDTTIVLRPDGPELRRYRRMCRMALGSSAMAQYTPLQQSAVARFIKDMTEHHAQNPNGDSFFMGQLRLTAVRSIMAIAYGIEVEDEKHEYVRNAENSAAYLGKSLQPDRYLVNFLPFLRHIPEWFPGAAFKREARVGSMVREITGILPFREVEKEMKSGSAPPSFVSMLLANIDDPNVPEGDKYNRDHVQSTARGMYNAGVDTTNSTMNSFIAAMLQHPEVQRKAQAELDLVVGTWQLPSIEDRERLPYVHAIVKETMRWQPAIPFGIPHRNRQDDIYKGYHIPKGATIIANIWYASDMEELVCVGQLVAESMAFLMVASILSSFTILPPLDQTEEQKIEWHGIQSNQPLPFRCRFVPRQAQGQ